jgi:hypothetical protein
VGAEKTNAATNKTRLSSLEFPIPIQISSNSRLLEPALYPIDNIADLSKVRTNPVSKEYYRQNGRKVSPPFGFARSKVLNFLFAADQGRPYTALLIFHKALRFS